MQILMRKGEGETPEWFVIEMQGDLESRNKEHLEGKFIGDLHYNKEGVPIMIIGHHILYGKVCSSITRLLLFTALARRSRTWKNHWFRWKESREVER